jgi:hypothetical protein
VPAGLGVFLLLGSNRPGKPSDNWDCAKEEEENNKKIRMLALLNRVVNFIRLFFLLADKRIT